MATVESSGGSLKGDIGALSKSNKKLWNDENLLILEGWWMGLDVTEAAEGTKAVREKHNGDDKAKKAAEEEIAAMTRADRGATVAVAKAAQLAKVDVLSQGADAAKVKKADDEAKKASDEATKQGASADVAELEGVRARVGVLSDKVDADKSKKATDAAKAAEEAARKLAPSQDKLGALAYAENDDPIVKDANIYGGQQALKITAAVPTAMAACYLLLVLYFVSKGGYKQIHLTGEQVSGGVEGPQEH